MVCSSFCAFTAISSTHVQYCLRLSTGDTQIFYCPTVKYYRQGFVQAIVPSLKFSWCTLNGTAWNILWYPVDKALIYGISCTCALVQAASSPYEPKYTLVYNGTARGFLYCPVDKVFNCLSCLPHHLSIMVLHGNILCYPVDNTLVQTVRPITQVP